jgi:hypothetical protein
MTAHPHQPAARLSTAGRLFDGLEHNAFPEDEPCER